MLNVCYISQAKRKSSNVLWNFYNSNTKAWQRKPKEKKEQKKITKLIFANTKQKSPAENRQTESRSEEWNTIMAKHMFVVQY